MKRQSASITVLVLAVATAAPQASAQIPWGSEFRVNTVTANAQRRPAVSSDASGNVVVVWESDGQDGSLAGVYAKRYDASGATIGVEFRANSHTTGNQWVASVASSATGDFIIVWASDGQDGNGSGVFGRRFNELGAALGTEFQVNTYTTGGQTFPVVGADQNGNFMVVWYGPGEGDTGLGIFARRYTAAGVAGPEFRVNEHTTDAQGNPAIAMDEDGKAVVVWRSLNQDGSDFGIYGRRFSNTGVALGNEFKANTYTTGAQDNPSVSYRGDGSFIVVWQSNGEDGSGQGIYARHVDANGNPQGLGFRVNTTTANVQDVPSVAAYANSGFVVTWRGNGPGDTSGVFGQSFGPTGTAQGGEFLVNTYTTNTQSIGGVASAPNGVFAVVWSSNGQDGSDYGIYAQRFGDLIFEDGFE
jgi:hypothetical protein